MTGRFHSFLMGTAIVVTAVADAGTDVPGDTPAEEPHASSSYILAAISSGLPKYQPPQPAAPSPKAAPMAAPGKTASDITSMPAFIVRDVKIPTEEKVMTYKAWTKVAMDKYLGPSDGLDRGLLSAVTLTQLWKKVPILGSLIEFKTMSNEDRALDAGGANDTIPYPHPPPKVKNDPDADVSH